MAVTLRLSDEQSAALRARADKEGRSMQQVARAALDDYLLRAEDDELTDRLAEAALLHSLARNHPLVDGNKRLAWLATFARDD